MKCSCPTLTVRVYHKTVKVAGTGKRQLKLRSHCARHRIMHIHGLTNHSDALVEEVRKFEVIYNPALTANHNKDKRQTAWKIVSEGVGQSRIYYC